MVVCLSPCTGAMAARNRSYSSKVSLIDRRSDTRVDSNVPSRDRGRSDASPVPGAGAGPDPGAIPCPCPSLGSCSGLKAWAHATARLRTCALFLLCARNG